MTSHKIITHLVSKCHTVLLRLLRCIIVSLARIPKFLTHLTEIIKMRLFLFLQWPATRTDMIRVCRVFNISYQNSPSERSLFVRVNHPHAELALLPFVGPGVPTVPGSLACSTAEVTEYSVSALVRGFLKCVEKSTVKNNA